MRFPHLIEAVYYQPWSITPAGFQSIHALARKRLLGGGDLLTEREQARLDAVKADGAETDFFGNPLPKLRITADGVAIVPVKGMLILHGGLMERMCGACSYDDIKRDLNTAAGTRDIRKIVLDVSSPGGMSMGCGETAKLIEDIIGFGIPVEARTDTCIGSAAYYLVAACTKISITPSSTIGSVGSYTAILDESKAYELAGLRMEVIRSGDVKGAGIPGTSLTDAQRADLQARCDEHGRLFREWVISHRMIDESLLQGQAFVGGQALVNGFADELLFDIEESDIPVEDDGEPEDS